MKFTAFRHTNNPNYNPNDVYIQLGKAQWKVPNADILKQLGISKIEKWYNTPMRYYKGELKTPQQIIQAIPSAGQYKIGNKYHQIKNGKLVESPFNKYASTLELPTGLLSSFPSSGSPLPAGEAEKLTPYQLAIEKGKKSGVSPQQISRQYAQKQPTNYYKVKSSTGYDVYDQSGRHITLPEFKKLGLNIDHIPEKTGTSQTLSNQTGTSQTTKP